MPALNNPEDGFVVIAEFEDSDYTDSVFPNGAPDISQIAVGDTIDGFVIPGWTGASENSWFGGETWVIRTYLGGDAILIASDEPFGLYRRVADLPQFSNQLLSYAGGYWWTTGATSEWPTEPRIWWSEDLLEWNEVARLTSPDGLYVQNFQLGTVRYHEESERWWVAARFYGRLDDSPADVPAGWYRACVLSAATPDGAWTTTQTYFGALADDAPTNAEYGGGRREVDVFPYYRVYPFDPRDDSYVVSACQTNGKVVYFDNVTIQVLPAYSFFGSYWQTIVSRHDASMWYADSPLGPWVRVPLRKVLWTYNWYTPNNAYITASTEFNVFPEPDAWTGSGGTPMIVDGQANWLYMNNDTYASGLPIEGPWTSVELPVGYNIASHPAVWDSKWVFYLYENSENRLAVLVGDNPGTIESVPFEVPIGWSEFTYYSYGDGAWLIAAWEVDDLAYEPRYYLSPPGNWRDFDAGSGAGWGISLA